MWLASLLHHPSNSLLFCQKFAYFKHCSHHEHTQVAKSTIVERVLQYSSTSKMKSQRCCHCSCS